MTVHRVDIRKGTVDPWDAPLTTTDASPRYAVGTRRIKSAADVSADNSDLPYGEQEWVYIKNDEGSAISAGQILVAGSGAGSGTRGFYLGVGVVSEGAELPDRVVGVAQHAIPADYYGWVVRRGIATILGDGSVAAGDQINSAAAGVATTAVYDDAAITDTSEYIIGNAITADSGSPVTFLGYLRGVG